MERPVTRHHVLEVAAVFSKLGLVAFGGPAAHIALMRREVVRRRGWLDDETFLEYFAACQLVPGPSSTELAILLGYKRAGWAGLLVAGALFILPAMLLMLAAAAAYTRLGSLPAAVAVLHGVRPVVVAVVAWALTDLGRRLIGGPAATLLAAATLALGLAGVNPIVLLVCAGLALAAWRRAAAVTPVLAFGGPALGAGAGLPKTALLFLTFLKLGAVSFGGGYILLAFLHAELVSGPWHLTDHQLIDAVAISQATPGPVFTIATFAGYLVAGLPGALLATLGIFLPGFALVPFLDRIVAVSRRRTGVRAFLEGVNLGALGLVGAVGVQLGLASIAGPFTAAVAAGAFVILLRWPLAAPATVIAGAALGLLGAGLR